MENNVGSKMTNALRLASIKGKTHDILRIMKQDGPEVLKSIDSDRKTVLHYLCQEGYEEIVEFVLSDRYEVDVNAQDVNGWTPLHFACRGGNFDTIQLLLEKGADPSILAVDNSSPLHYFVRSKMYNPIAIHKTLDLLVEKGKNVDLQNNIGECALHHAASNGVPLFVLYLLKNKATPNLRNIKGETPLHYAIRENNCEVVEILLKMGADPTIDNIFDLAFESGSDRIIQLVKNWMSFNNIEIPPHLHPKSNGIQRRSMKSNIQKQHRFAHQKKQMSEENEINFSHSPPSSRSPLSSREREDNDNENVFYNRVYNYNYPNVDNGKRQKRSDDETLIEYSPQENSTLQNISILNRNNNHVTPPKVRLPISNSNDNINNNNNVPNDNSKSNTKISKRASLIDLFSKNEEVRKSQQFVVEEFIKNTPLPPAPLPPVENEIKLEKSENNNNNNSNNNLFSGESSYLNYKPPTSYLTGKSENKMGQVLREMNARSPKPITHVNSADRTIVMIEVKSKDPRSPRFDPSFDPGTDSEAEKLVLRKNIQYRKNRGIRTRSKSFSSLDEIDYSEEKNVRDDEQWEKEEYPLKNSSSLDNFHSDSQSSSGKLKKSRSSDRLKDKFKLKKKKELKLDLKMAQEIEDFITNESPKNKVNNRDEISPFSPFRSDSRKFGEANGKALRKAKSKEDNPAIPLIDYSLPVKAKSTGFNSNSNINNINNDTKESETIQEQQATKSKSPVKSGSKKYLLDKLKITGSMDEDDYFLQQLLSYCNQNLSKKVVEWLCHGCKKENTINPMVFFTPSPLEYDLIPDDQKESRAKISSDLCSIDNSKYFVRGLLEIPISLFSPSFFSLVQKKPKLSKVLSLGVWLNIPSSDFYNLVAGWKEEKNLNIKGTIANDLPFYGKTSGLSATMNTQVGGYRPKIVLAQSNNALATDSQSGISMVRFVSFLEEIFFPPLPL